MIIVSGTITLHPGQLARFLADSVEAMRLARRAKGNLAFVVAAYPLLPDVANVYEAWESEADLLAFRQGGLSADMRTMIKAADVRRHQISSSGPA